MIDQEVHVVQARLVGVLIPETAQLQIHSVYDRVLNLQVKNHRTLVSLVIDESDMAAMSMLVDHLPSIGVVGTNASISQRVLTLESTCASGGPWNVDLRAAPPWSGEIGFSAQRHEANGAADRLERLLRDCGRPGGLFGLAIPKADNTLCRFARRVLDSDRRGSRPVDWSGMVGLGIGLTPSGDDFLTGVLLAEQLFRCGTTAEPGVDRDAVRTRLYATTDAGATLLSAAVGGRYPCYLLRLAEMLKSGGVLRCDSLNHGQTSATDAVTGLWWYLNAFVIHHRVNSK